ncbi:nuclear transport factor 2 family protein [Streptomyces sp. NPDC001508]|uniref:nuclear transport factor 2 family protein n=1 Tax=Streptomyces sp. NPDC001508 TaxID=3154656 RepID=UPI00332BC271
MTEITPQLVAAAYEAVSSGDREKTALYWSEDLRFLAPGTHAHAGWRVGIDDFLAYVQGMLEASGESWNMTPITLLINNEDGYSIDVNSIHAVRHGAPEGSTSPFDVLDISGVQMLKWENGKVVEGYGGIFGAGATNYDQWWSPMGADGKRLY